MKGKGLIWFTSTRDSFTYNVVTDFQLKEMKCVVAFAQGGKERSYKTSVSFRGQVFPESYLDSFETEKREDETRSCLLPIKQTGRFFSRELWHQRYVGSPTLEFELAVQDNSLWYCKKNLDISLPIPITRQSLLLNSGFKVLFNKSVNFYTTLKPTYHGCQVFIWIWNKDFVAKQLTSSSFPSFECDQKKKLLEH